MRIGQQTLTQRFLAELDPPDLRIAKEEALVPVIPSITGAGLPPSDL
jgi:hypothetical protein